MHRGETGKPFALADAYAGYTVLVSARSSAEYYPVLTVRLNDAEQI